MTPHERARARRADIRRALRALRPQLASLDPAVYRPAIDAVMRLRRLTCGPGLVCWPYMRLEARIEALNRAGELRRTRRFPSWRDAHARALDTARVWNALRANEYRGLPQ